MLHRLVGGAWGRAIQPWLEAAMRTLPVGALLFLPVALGIGSLFEWSHAEVVEADPLLQSKAAYLNVPFFLVRAAVYFAVWILFSRVLLAQLPADPADGGDLEAQRRGQRWGAAGILAYVVTTTFASVDWAMSLEPHWFSTIYGVQFIVGQALSAFCLAIAAVAWLERSTGRQGPGPDGQNIDPSHLRDLGNLLLAFVMLWAYVAFSQYLIIWSGNLPEEATWYLSRTAGGWQAVALFLILFHFAVPFVILLGRRSKERARVIGRLALALLLLRTLDLAWMILPAFHDQDLAGFWMLPVAFLAVGGLWAAVFFRALRLHPPALAPAEPAGGELQEATAP